MPLSLPQRRLPPARIKILVILNVPVYEREQFGAESPVSLLILGF